MIKFNTTRFGALEVEEGKIINFPDGIPGFSEIKQYVLIDYKDTPLKWLQSVEDPDVAFIVAEPTIISPDYKIKLDEVIRQQLQLQSEDDLAVLVTIRVENGKVIANLQGPILLNAVSMRGMQVVLDRI